ncbi:MAG TPA: phage resistance protein, partial [Thermoanaerobaculia bacterium]
MTFISELIDVPERVHAGDFVLKLSEGVSAAGETVRDYVVTDELQKTFDAALSLIRDAVLTSSSKAAFLHGSFGSGKSHFMAMLHLLLQKNPIARAKPELAPVLHEHNEWIEPRRFLLVPYHLIGAKNLESAILGGYASQVRTLHPEAATPGFYRSEALLMDAARMRVRLGDTKFFEDLNERNGAAGGWGKLATGWTAESYESAATAAPESEDRSRLVGDLIDRFFEVARGGSDFVDLDTGLSVMTHHAKALGY